MTTPTSPRTGSHWLLATRSGYWLPAPVPGGSQHRSSRCACQTPWHASWRSACAASSASSGAGLATQRPRTGSTTVNASSACEALRRR